MPWRPLPGSGDASPRPVRGGLDRLLDLLSGATAATATSIFEQWTELVGPQVGAHTRPLTLRDGVLVVGVDDPAWASQLKYLEGDLRERLATAPGGAAVQRIEFRVEHPR